MLAYERHTTTSRFQTDRGEIVTDNAMPLAKAIEELRENIVEAVKAAKGEAMKFELGNIELELSVVATREGQAGGKLSFSVLGIGAEANLGGKLSSATTHKVKLVLTPPKNTLVSSDVTNRGR